MGYCIPTSPPANRRVPPALARDLAALAPYELTNAACPCCDWLLWYWPVENAVACVHCDVGPSAELIQARHQEQLRCSA